LEWGDTFTRSKVIKDKIKGKASGLKTWERGIVPVSLRHERKKTIRKNHCERSRQGASIVLLKTPERVEKRFCLNKKGRGMRSVSRGYQGLLRGVLQMNSKLIGGAGCRSTSKRKSVTKDSGKVKGNQKSGRKLFD